MARPDGQELISYMPRGSGKLEKGSGYCKHDI